MNNNKKKSGAQRPVKTAKAKTVTTICGSGTYEQGGQFNFAPDDPVDGMVEPGTRNGKLQWTSDGMGWFIPDDKKKKSGEAVIIRRSTLGHISRLKDGTYRMTVSVGEKDFNEVLRIMQKEAKLLCK